jgi:threonine synthase
MAERSRSQNYYNNPMQYHSTNHKSKPVSFKQAVLKGLAFDGGLYLPEEIKSLNRRIVNNLADYDLEEIIFRVFKNFIGTEIKDQALKKIISEAFNFKTKLKKLEADLYCLELFHGPTLAFKDFGARFMARVMQYFTLKTKRELLVLAATSGDTGSAVAKAFLGLKNTRVIVLYPSGKISETQEKQITTLGKNITALEVKGTFDDCQKMVKQAFLDKNLNQRFFLASANSINFSRLMPQIYYYLWALKKLASKNLKDNLKKREIVFSVPSGNFGNLTAGLLAKKMGFKIEKFVAATNRNDTFVKYLKSGDFWPKASVKTLSNAMDVGNPSNFARIYEIYNQDLAEIKKDIIGFSFDDNQTKKALKEIKDDYNYIVDPHTAVAYLGLKKYFNSLSKKEKVNKIGIFLATASPAKFSEEVEPVVKAKVKIPKRLKRYFEKKKKSVLIENSFKDLKRILSIKF